MQFRHVVTLFPYGIAKYCTIGQLAIFDWKQGAMHMRIQLITVDVETDDILLTKLLGDKVVNVLCPLLDVR